MSIEENMWQVLKTGELKGPIHGEQFLWFFKRLRMIVRLETRIRILEHGELKTIGEKLKETLQCGRNSRNLNEDDCLSRSTK